MEWRWKLAIFYYCCATAILSTSGLLEGVKDYSGYRVYRLNVRTPEILDALHALQDRGSVDLWKEPEPDSIMDLMVSPDQDSQLLELIHQYNVSHEVLHENLNVALAAERKQMNQRLGSGFGWDSYHRLETIYDWMHSLERSMRINQSMVTVEVVEVGESFEKRPMKVLKITRNWSVINGVNRTAIWLDGGIHAREWIAPATVTFIANAIIEANKRSEYWASMFDWYIAPVINPDGYEYSHTNDRFWRKTRSYPRRGSSIIDHLVNFCVGADPNRNWDFHWGGPGGSGNPCAPNYRGRENASEVEVQNLQNFILSKNNTFKLYVSMHSYSQLILIPWGHSYSLADDYEDMLQVARKALKNVENVQGTIYRAGDTANILYPAAGGSHDWAKGVAGIKYSYTVELPDRGFYGFLLPASKIIPTGKEALELVKSMAEDMIDIYYYNDMRRQ